MVLHVKQWNHYSLTVMMINETELFNNSFCSCAITSNCAFISKTVEFLDANRLTEGQPGVTDLQIHVDVCSKANAVVGQSGACQWRILIIAVPDTWEWKETEWVIIIIIIHHQSLTVSSTLLPNAPTARTPKIRTHTKMAAKKRNRRRNSKLTTIAITSPLCESMRYHILYTRTRTHAHKKH